MSVKSHWKILAFVLWVAFSGFTAFKGNLATAGVKSKKRSAGVAVVPSKKEEGDFVVEKRSDGTTVKYKRKNQYDFEGANVDGLYKKPTGAYISNIKEVKGRTIIRVRENFDAEVDDSARLLK